MSFEILPGTSSVIGAVPDGAGTNFCVYSKHGSRVELLLFDDVASPLPSHSIHLSPESGHRTFHYWHAYLKGVRAGQLYGYRVDGRYDPPGGHRFDSRHLLLDPYGRSVAIPAGYRREAEAHPVDLASCMKSVVVGGGKFDWEGDRPLRRPFSETVIYEMHVGGFTRNPNSGVAESHRGTYLGVIDKIPYLQSLGVTAVELLPVFQFDESEAPNGLRNYWGYDPVSFFAPHVGYSTCPSDPRLAIDEFRLMVKELHRAGIEVILDVVYNHTAEGNEFGPTFCFKGLDNSTYYMLGDSSQPYYNFSGTGNTVNTNHSIVRRMILDSLRYWVDEMHVDGFRFDLAGVMARDIDGEPVNTSPILWDIETDPTLSGTKLIAEAWDASGLYLVGSFFGDRWKEWNGQFRDDVRAFVKSDPGMVGKLANRILASPDLYGHEGREAGQSVNFVTCHDGFTLNDVVSYDDKHNEENLEENRDGTVVNYSWNCGVEGPSSDPEIERLRLRQIKNMLVINLLSLGTPMLSMGDEIRRTQLGNNNTYCQDNETSWLDWDLVETNHELLCFAQKLIRFRLDLPLSFTSELSLNELLRQTRIEWHGVRLNQPDWSRESRSIALTIRGNRFLFHWILNAYWEALDFELPRGNDGRSVRWKRVLDTARESPDDFCGFEQACPVGGASVLVDGRSTVVLAGHVNEDDQASAAGVV